MAKVTTEVIGDVALLPLQPIVPVVETLEWLSDTMVSKNGTEEILQLRAAPRQTFQYTYPEQAWQKTIAQNVQYDALSKRWAIPVWTEAQHLGALGANSGTIAVNTEGYSYRAPGLALLWQDETHWQLLDLESVISSTLDILGGDVTAAYTNAYVMPVRYGRVVGSFSRRISADNVVTNVQFRCEDNAIPDAGDDPDQFLSEDIYFDNPLSADGVTRTINTRVDTVDYGLGLFTQRAPWLHNRIDYNRNVMCTTQDEVAEFKIWLARRAGKVKKFWEPSFDNDLRKQSTGNLTTTFLVARDGLTDWSALPRSHIAFELDDGSWLARTVSSISTISGTQLQLNLDTSLAVPASRIRRVSWLGLKRLNTDRVELHWNGNGIAEASMQVTEIKP